MAKSNNRSNRTYHDVNSMPQSEAFTITEEGNEFAYQGIKHSLGSK